MTSTTIARVWQSITLTLAAIGFATAVTGIVLSPQRTWPNVLLANVYALSIALASALFIAIQYLSGAGWWVVVRRVAEATMSALPVVALTMPAIFLGRQALSRIAIDAAGHAAMSASKAFYLSTPFMLLRTVVVLGVWIFFVVKLRQFSLRQDRDGSPIHHRQLVRYSAIFVVVFAISFLLMSVDWLMAIDPRWSSTIFAVYVFAGLFASGLAALTLIVVALRIAGPLRTIVTDAHVHDLGALLFAFSTFWAYIWLSQYLLIWYGNLPEEITHYLRRTSGAWRPIFLLNPILNWVVPFLLLIRWDGKHRVRVLAPVCLLLIVGHWLDLYLLIMPDLFEAPAFGPPEALIPLGYAGLFAYLTSRALARAPLMPVHDPFLQESLQHEL
jgi:hypothetical protein